MTVAVLVVVGVTVLELGLDLGLVRHATKRTRRPWREHVPVRPRVCVAVDIATVAMTQARRGHGFEVSAGPRGAPPDASARECSRYPGNIFGDITSWSRNATACTSQMGSSSRSRVASSFPAACLSL